MKLFRHCQIRRGLVAIRWSVPFALIAMVSVAHAKTGDRNQPMTTVQDSVKGFNAPNTITTLTGHVVVTQGSMKATGEVAQLYLDADSQISRIVMKGHPAHIQQLDDNDRLMTGESPTLDYDNIHGIAVLTPDAVVTQQGMGDAHADKLTYNTQTTYFTGTGNVSMTYLPKQRQGAHSSPAPSTPAAAASAAAIQK